jgi:hypothetical protein
MSSRNGDVTLIKGNRWCHAWGIISYLLLRTDKGDKENPMSEIEIKEKLFQKSLARRKINLEVEDLRFVLSLEKMGKRLKRELREKFDPVLALQVDAIEFLENVMGEKCLCEDSHGAA